MSECINEFLESMGEDYKKMARINSNNSVYRYAITSIWKDEAASKTILDHTNAFYIRQDTKRRKGPDKDKPYMVCEICTDDPVVRSELDTHKELLALALRTNGLSFEELRLLSAKGNMRKRHPFKV